VASTLTTAGRSQWGRFHLLLAARSHPKIICAILIAVFIIAVAAVYYYIRVLSFSENAVLQDLQEASGIAVTVRSYRRTHFPSPGCVLEGVEFRNAASKFTIIHIDKLVIKGNYLGILNHHVQEIKAVGAHVSIPPFGSNISFQTQHSNIVVDEIIANGTSVEFVSSDSQQKPLLFDVHDALLTDVRWGSPIRYQLKFHNPEPPGELSVTGRFGPWADGHPEETPLSGEYSLDHADLSVYGGIGGVLTSTGKFDGVFKRIAIRGTTDTPDFVVKSGGHKIRLKTDFDAYIDAMHGDTFLNRVDARFVRTRILAAGSVAGILGRKGKFTRLHLTSRQGRIEDILGLFVSAPRSPMSGRFSGVAQVEMAPGNGPFLKKVKLQTTFGVGQGSFSEPGTQKDVDALSAGARGESKEDPETVLTDLKGAVALIGGVARFSDLTFGVPGAKARMHGTYNILNYKIDLHGRMRVDTRISKTSSGVKALLLKALDPFFKKKKKGEVVPVHIEGTYQNPQFGLDVTQPQKKSLAH
jgi:hypothetical protein